MNEQQILEILRCGERINLECKKAENKLPNSVWETYSSFANTEGGIILFGVEENLQENDFDKRFTFVSIKNPAQRLKDFWNTINSSKVSCNILVDADAGFCEVKGKNIIWIRVPRANYRQRPVYINDNPMKGSYKRNYEGDYHCTEYEIKAMFRDANDSCGDGTTLNGYTLNDIDANTLRSYRIEFEHSNPGHIWNGYDNREFLRNMGGYGIDRATGQEWLTAAGLLMFGKGLAVRERFDNIRMDFIDESNLAPGSRYSDRLTYDGSWENNLYNFLRLILPKLMMGIKRPFRLEGIVRVDDTPIHKAIREAAVNMIIHSDYMLTGILKVKKTDSGFVFSNPGKLKLPVQDIYEGGHSLARNPKIQNMFRMIGFGENLGSGFPTILKSWENENWRKPYLTEDTDRQTVELKLWMIELMPSECCEYLQRLYGPAFSALSYPEQIILGTAYLENEATNSRLQAVLDMSGTEVGHLLSRLTDKQMLLYSKKGRWVSYRLNYTDTETSTEISDSAKTDTETSTETGGSAKTDTETSTEISDSTKTGTETSTEISGSIKTDTETDTETILVRDSATCTETAFLPHTASEKLVLACIAEKPSVTIEQLAQKTGISRSGVRYVLNRLREKGILCREGPQKGGQWIIKTDTDK